MNSMSVINILIIVAIVTAGFIIAVTDDLITSIISASILGLLMALEFLLLKAPEVAFAEACVTVILMPVLFLITLRKVKDKSCQAHDEAKGDK